MAKLGGFCYPGIYRMMAKYGIQFAPPKRISEFGPGAKVLLGSKLDLLVLSRRVSNLLKEHEICTIEKLIRQRGKELLKLKRLGYIALREIEKTLSRKGLTIGMVD